MSSPVSARSAEGSKIPEEMFEKDETVFMETRNATEGSSEGNGNVIIEAQAPKNNVKNVTESENEQTMNIKEIVIGKEGSLRCCCDDKSNSNNHKSLLSRLRNFTDRFSMSFDTKETTAPKISKHVTPKALNKSNSVSSSSERHVFAVCKRCNLRKDSKDMNRDPSSVELISIDKRAMTLPKTRKSHDCKNKSWRTMFAKERRPSSSLEMLSASDRELALSKHKRNLSNPEGRTSMSRDNDSSPEALRLGEFVEIDVRKDQNPEIVVNPSSSCGIDEDISSKVEIRRSSASMEDMSKIAKPSEILPFGSNLEQTKAEEFQHTGSLDSMLCKESSMANKKAIGFSSPATTKKSSTSLFSRLKSGMSIDGTRSNSGSLNDSMSQPQVGWISSLTASFRPKRQQQTSKTPTSPHSSPSREEIK